MGGASPVVLRQKMRTKKKPLNRGRAIISQQGELVKSFFAFFSLFIYIQPKMSMDGEKKSAKIQKNACNLEQGVIYLFSRRIRRANKHH